MANGLCASDSLILPGFPSAGEINPLASISKRNPMRPANITLSCFGLLVGLVVLCAEPSAGSAQEITIASATSLRAPLTELAELFEEQYPQHQLHFSFGPSNNLARQIEAGAPIDLFASADPRIIEKLAEKNQIARSSITPLASNKLVLIARDGLKEPMDLDRLRAGQIERFALPNAAVPVGWYARQWLRSQSLLEAITPKVLQTEHARATLSAVDMGHADAALIYITDARLAKHATIALEIPENEQPEILYLAAIVPRDEASDKLSSAFLSFLTHETGVRVFAEAGFLPLPRAETHSSANPGVSTW
jgi:molybdate transport system substrate-binding protein